MTRKVVWKIMTLTVLDDAKHTADGFSLLRFNVDFTERMECGWSG